MDVAIGASFLPTGVIVGAVVVVEADADAPASVCEKFGYRSVAEADVIVGVLVRLELSVSHPETLLLFFTFLVNINLVMC